MSALDELHQGLVKAAAEELRIPCGAWSEGPPWLSEDPRLREVAAAWCQACPVIDECDQAAKWLRVDFGVWGGRDRTKRPRKAGLHTVETPGAEGVAS